MMEHSNKSELEQLEKKCPRCGSASANSSNPSGRCSACLKKLASNKKKVGHYLHEHKVADDALRRQKGKNGTAKKKSKGLGSRKAIIKKVHEGEKKAGQVLSPDRINNSKGYSSSNTRMVPKELNRGRHHVDGKKLRAWQKHLKKSDDLNDNDFSFVYIGAEKHPVGKGMRASDISHHYDILYRGKKIGKGYMLHTSDCPITGQEGMGSGKQHDYEVRNGDLELTGNPKMGPGLYWNQSTPSGKKQSPEIAEQLWPEDKINQLMADHHDKLGLSESHLIGKSPKFYPNPNYKLPKENPINPSKSKGDLKLWQKRLKKTATSDDDFYTFVLAKAEQMGNQELLTLLHDMHPNDLVNFINNEDTDVDQPPLKKTEFLEKGIMRRLAPKPAVDSVNDVGGGTGSQYRPIKDASHKKRAAFKLVKDRISSNPHSIKKIDGIPHILLHRGCSGDNTHDLAPHTVDKPDSIIHGEDGGQYTLRYNVANSFGEKVNSIWVPVHSIQNYSEYSWRQAAQSAFSPFSGDLTHGDNELTDIPLSREDNKYYFKDVPHVLVGPGEYKKASKEEVDRASEIDNRRPDYDPDDRSPDMKREVKLKIKSLKKNEFLEKGRLQRLFPNAQGKQHLRQEDSYQPSTDVALQKRGQIELVKKLIAKGNKAAYKTIDGKLHVLLHRGIIPRISNAPSRATPINIEKDGSLSHDKHGMYTDNYDYAQKFSGKDGHTHSVWVPVDAINRNGHFEHYSGVLKERALKGKAKSDQDGYGHVGKHGNHVLVNPGRYQHASKEEIDSFLKNHTPTVESAKYSAKYRKYDIPETN